VVGGGCRENRLYAIPVISRMIGPPTSPAASTRVWICGCLDLRPDQRLLDDIDLPECAVEPSAISS
jgi:hypothetical protein